MTTPGRRRIASIVARLCLVCALVELTCSVSWAQGPVDAPVIGHEHFDPTRAFVPAAGAGAGDTEEPPPDGRVIHAGVALPPPRLAATPGSDEVAYDERGAHTPSDASVGEQNGPQKPRQRKLGLDDDTDKEGMLNYHTVFNPSVVPYKRGGVLDRVEVGDDGNYYLTVEDPTLRGVDVVGDDHQPDRDRFWGSVLVDARPGTLIPIPSVAAGARILTAQTNPEVPIEFLVDGAENMFVRLEATGSVRVNFLTDARHDYFALEDVPSGLTLAEVGRYSRAPHVSRKSPIYSPARKVVRAIGIDRDDELRDALDKLVAYFRDFEAVPLDALPAGQDRYATIALSKRGVCRHRTFAFIVTAHYLGIRSRYVYNEAHAFVEVFVPLRGWTRIDLGGGAEGLRVHNGDGKIRHTSSPDRFPQPERFRDEVAETFGEDGASSGFEHFDKVEGLPPSPDAVQDTVAELAPGPQGDASEDAPLAAQGDTDRDPPHDGPASFAPETDAAALPAPGTDPASDPPETGTTPPATADAPFFGKLDTRIVINSPPAQLWRGEELHVQGRITAAGGDAPVASRPVHLVAVPLGTGTLRTTLASGQTNDLGAFDFVVEVPATLPIGQWDIYVYFPGDGQFEPSRSP